MTNGGFVWPIADLKKQSKISLRQPWSAIKQKGEIRTTVKNPGAKRSAGVWSTAAVVQIRSFFFFFLFLPKSLWISRVVSHLYGTEFDIWAGFGPICLTENVCNQAKVCYFFRAFFYVFMGKMNEMIDFLYIVKVSKSQKQIILSKGTNQILVPQ